MGVEAITTESAISNLELALFILQNYVPKFEHTQCVERSILNGIYLLRHNTPLRTSMSDASNILQGPSEVLLFDLRPYFPVIAKKFFFFIFGGCVIFYLKMLSD